MKSFFKYAVFSLIVTPVILSKQEKENVYGAYRSIVNSSRAAIILYRAVTDYQRSLSGIPYNTDQYHKIRHEVHMRVANRILQLSTSNRGIYLKLGQYLGNLEKVVPWEFTHVLKVLQDSVPPISYDQIKVVIQNDLHKKVGQVFKEIGEQAIAAASLAQVHKAILTENGKEVALKIQYPFLQVQSKWDLRVLRKITQFCNYLIKKNKSSDIDLVKLFTTWTDTLIEQLDFNIQISHALKTKQLFKDNPFVYIPQYYTHLSSNRLIVMEFIDGIKINNRSQLQRSNIKPQLVGKNLIDIFSTMIYTHGFIHCDAHPGNLLVRKKNNQLGHEIVLLDHGLYRSIQPQTIKSFSGLWVSLMLQNKKDVYKYANQLQIHDHIEYLPLIFLYRSTNSNKKIGQSFTESEKKEVREKDLANFDSINDILQDLPPQLMFIIRASNLIASHNITLGGSNRDRLFEYTKRSLHILYPSTLSYSFNYLNLLFRLWIFQNFYGLYKLTYGTLSS